MHEDEIKQLKNGEIIRFGRGSYYKINKATFDEVSRLTYASNPPIMLAWEKVRKIAKKKSEELERQCKSQKKFVEA